MWGRERNRANLGMVLAWGNRSSNRGMGSSSIFGGTHGRTALGRGRGDGGGCSGEGRRSSGGGRAMVGPVSKGRRGSAHPRSEVVSSVRLHNGWAREGDERMGGREL